MAKVVKLMYVRRTRVVLFASSDLASLARSPRLSSHSTLRHHSHHTRTQHHLHTPQPTTSVGAAKAAPSPAIGQALGPLGLNMMDFCKLFNERTAHIVDGTPLPVVLTAQPNRTFDFTYATPSTAWFLKKAVGEELGSAKPGRKSIGRVHVKQIYEIAKVKQGDASLLDTPLEDICKMVAGTAKSVGITVSTVREGEEEEEEEDAEGEWQV